MQDKSVAIIGRIMSSVSEKVYENYIQDMFPNEDYSMLIADFMVDLEQQNCAYLGINLLPVNENNYLPYAYRKGSSRGGDITFTTKAGDITKKFSKFQQQIGTAIVTAEQLAIAEETIIFRSLRECVNSHYDSIVNQLNNKLNELDKKAQQRCGFSICVEIGGQKRYVADFLVMQHLLESNGTEGKSVKYNVRSEAKDKTCSICLENKPLIHGFASPYKFSTVDKPGMVSGFFQQKSNWKNYPICSDCAFDFEMGRDHIAQNLRQSFYGKSYFIIPQTILKTEDRFLKKIIKKIQGIKYQATAEGKATLRREDYIMHQFGKMYEEEQNKFFLNLLFYEENPTTKAMKIKLALEEILPSRFKQLFIDVPAKVNAHPLYKEAIYRKKEKHDLIFQFGLFKDFFADDFYNITQTVFLGLPLAKEILFSRFMRVIRDNYNKKQSSDSYVESSQVTVKKAHLIWHYLLALDIIQPINKINMAEENLPLLIQEREGKKAAFNETFYENFVKDNNKFLDNDIKEGLFAIGILVRFLYGLQARNLANTPFEKKLYGYQLDPIRIKVVYKETLSKISQYTNAYTYLKLRDIINKKFTCKSYELNQMSNDEISFFFVAGLEMGSDFKTKPKTESENKK